MMIMLTMFAYQYGIIDYDIPTMESTGFARVPSSLKAPGWIRQGKALNTGVPRPLRVWVIKMIDFDNPNVDISINSGVAGRGKLSQQLAPKIATSQQAARGKPSPTPGTIRKYCRAAGCVAGALPHSRTARENKH